MLKAFREFNLRLSARIEALLPQCRNSIYDDYDRMAQGLVGTAPLRVLDVGGGRESHIAEFCTEGSTVIAFDISAEELSQNQKATQKIVADACREFPLPVGSVDLVTSYCVVEHLPDVSAFCRHAYQVLRPGGSMLHVFPCRNAVFSIMNRLIPFKASRWLISLFSGKPKSYGFPAYYDECSPGKMRRALVSAGFRVEKMEVNYYQSQWFTFFAPLYAVSVLCEFVLIALHVRPLCGHIVVLARKPSSGSQTVVSSKAAVPAGNHAFGEMNISEAAERRQHFHAHRN